MGAAHACHPAAMCEGRSGAIRLSELEASLLSSVGAQLYGGAVLLLSVVLWMTSDTVLKSIISVTACSL